MAKLSTPSHPCEVPFARPNGPSTPCGRDAYRKAPDGRWVCKPCRRRAGTSKPQSPFIVIGTSR